MNPQLLPKSIRPPKATQQFLKDLDNRARLEKNAMYPASLQVGCPIIGCMGLGYLGFDTVMCFVCEHQWSSDGVEPDDGLPVDTMKECPKCHVRIEKNGGCDHMTCSLCRHEFYW